MMDVIQRDVPRTLRRLARAPGFSATVVLSLTVGMAAAIALLGVVDTLFFREPAGLRDAGRVVAIGPWAGFARTTYPDFVDLRNESRSLESVGAFAFWSYSARIGSAVSPARGLLASHSLLPTLGITPRVGRAFVMDEDRPGAAAVALISARFRAQHFATDGDALGKTVRLAGIDFTIIGVLPAGFTAPDMAPVDLVLPIENAPWFGGREALVNRDYQWIRVVGRMRPSTAPQAAEAEATAIFRRANVGVRSVDQETLARAHVAVRSLREARRDPSAPSARVSLWLAVLAAVVLLIACANVASLLVARGIADRHELAVHVALGATSGRLAARALVEVGALVSVAVLLAGIAAQFANRALGTLLLADTVSAPPIDLRTVALAAAVGLCTCLGCALASVVRAVRTDPRAALGSQSRTATSSHQRSLRLLVAAQIALGVVLVSEAAVFVASLRNAARVDLGFDLDHLVLADVDLRAAGFTEANWHDGASRALDAVRRIPGVSDAGMTNAMTIPGYLNYSVTVPGRDSAPPGIDQGEPFISTITPGFVEALALPVARGRLLTDDDVAAKRSVVLVSERFARLYWPRENAVGQCVRLGRSTASPCAEVVGVVGDRRGSPAAQHGAAELYLPVRSTAFPEELARTFLGREIAVRVAGGHDITSELQRRLLDALPGLTSVRVRVGDAYLEAQTRSWRLGAVVIGAFAGIALALAAVGVFSVWSHAVASRRREFGIRGALGARPNDLAWLIGRDALGVATVGVLVGIAGAVSAASIVRAMAFGISPLDPRVLAVSGGVFLVVTCVAAVVPAARAALTNPWSVLASE